MHNYSEPLSNGRIEVITVADPGAQTNWTQLLPNGKTYEIIAVRQTLTTDINAANRQTLLQIVDNVNVLIDIYANITQTAGLIIPWTISDQTRADINLVTLQAIIPLPHRIRIPGNFTIRSQMINLQVGDTLTDIDITVATWINQTV